MTKSTDSGHPGVRRRLRNGDRGSATGWAIAVMAIGLLLAGLLFDGGTAMAAKASALNLAQQAARAGADQLDLIALRTTGEVRLEPAAAQDAAAAWLAQADAEGTVSATTDAVTVTVTVEQPAVMLTMVGISTYQLSATATAEAIQT